MVSDAQMRKMRADFKRQAKLQKLFDKKMKKNKKELKKAGII